MRVIGPGMVQKFRRHGLFIVGAPGVSTNVTVQERHVARELFQRPADQWHDGQRDRWNRLDQERGQFGRAAVWRELPRQQQQQPDREQSLRRQRFGLCGGVVRSATHNRVEQRFRCGLIGGSSGNVVENNSITGNSNGLLIQTGASGNTIRTNIVVGEPAEPAIENLRADRLRHQGRSARRTARGTRSRGIGASRMQDRDLPPVRIFPQWLRSDDLGTDGDARRPLASERTNGIGDHRRDRDRRQRSEPRCQISSVTSSESSAASDWTRHRTAQPQPAGGSEWSRAGTSLFDYGQVHQRLAAERQRGGFGPRTHDRR